MSAGGQHERDERSSLLSRRTSTDSSQGASRAGREITLNRFLATIFVVLAVLVFGTYLTVAPQTRIYESIVCRHYYDAKYPDRFPDRAWIPEKYCKLSAVQSEVALIQGVTSSLDALPSILLSYFYAQLADNPKYGRRIVLFFAVLGLIMEGMWVVAVCWFWEVFPLRFIWFGSAFQCIGGGNGMAISLLLTMIADVVPAERRATTFFHLTVTSVLAQLFARPLASWGMLKSPWLPFLIGVAVCFISTFAILLLPETVHLFKPAPEAPPEFSGPHLNGSANKSKRSRLRMFARESITSMTHSLAFIGKNRIIPLILATFFVITLGQKQLEVVLLYTSARYGISLAKAGFLFTIIAATTIVLLLGILPLASTFLMKRLHLSSNMKDLRLAQVSILFLAAGCFMLALAPSVAMLSVALAVYTLGSGFAILNRSLATSFVEPLHVARLYSLMSISSGLGDLVAGPLLAALYAKGLDLGTNWMGLPFVGTGLLHIPVIVAMFLIRLPPEAQERSETLDGDLPQDGI